MAEERYLDRAVPMNLASAYAPTQKSLQPIVTEAWVHQQYLLHGFHTHGLFRGYPDLTRHLRIVALLLIRKKAVHILNHGDIAEPWAR